MGREADLEDGHSKLDESRISHTKQAIQGPAQRFLSGPAKEPRTGLPILFYVALWILLSCSITLLNKRLLDMRFAYPCSLTTLHLAFTSVMTRILLRFGSLRMDTSLFPTNNTLYFRHIFLMALLFSLALVSGNKAYLYLSIPSIQLLKTLNPIVLLAASWVFRMKTPNAKTLAFSAFIVVGSLFACYGSADYNILGVTYMGVAIITHTVRLMMTQQLINTSTERDATAVMTLQYFAPLGAIIVGVLAALTEGPKMRLASFDLVGIFQITVNATLAFLLNLSTFHLIGITSSFTLCICAVVRDVVLIAASTLLRHHPLTVFQGVGYSFVFVGVVCGALKKA